MRQPNLEPEQVYAVSELNREVKWLLESHFGQIWVEGELSNLMRPSSGHLYFSLKDERSQIRCAMFRGDNRRLDFKPIDGAKVLVRARLGIYEARGDYQMVVERMMEVGVGALQRRFEETKKRLLQEGLFDSKHKKVLPVMPRTIGLVTSSTGAAVRDALNVLARRYPMAQVIIYPVTVQGPTAAPSIAAILKLANHRAECDVLLLLRGGGSLEDLWAFNEEIVARAIFASTLPLISGIGHEVDFTIADMVADVRAPTPSAAAELSSPDQAELQVNLLSVLRYATIAMNKLLERQCQRLANTQRRLRARHPANQLQQKGQRCDELEQRLVRTLKQKVSTAALRHRHTHLTLQRCSPARQLARRMDKISSLTRQLEHIMQERLQAAKLRVTGSNRALFAVSPHNTLKRGYAIVQTQTGKILLRSDQAKSGEKIKIQLQSGSIEGKISSVFDQQNRKIQST